MNSACLLLLFQFRVPDSHLFALGFIFIDWNIAPCCIRWMLKAPPPLTPIRMRTTESTATLNIDNTFFLFKNFNSSWLHKAKQFILLCSFNLLHFVAWCSTVCCMCSDTLTQICWKNLKMLIFKSHWGPQFKCGPSVYTLICLLNGHYSDQHPSIHLQSKRAYYMETYPKSVTQVLPCQQQQQQPRWRLPKALKMYSGDIKTLAELKPRR